jgi:glutaredoxin
MVEGATTAVPLDGGDRLITMYTRQGCHLCDEAWSLLQVVRTRHPFRLEAIDVDSHADLVAKYGDRVPVLVVDGQARLWGRINKVLLERLVQNL